MAIKPLNVANRLTEKKSMIDFLRRSGNILKDPVEDERTRSWSKLVC